MSTGPNAYDMRRAIEAILDDTGLPRHLQVGRILELFEDELLALLFDGSEDIPEEPPRRAKKAVKKRRAKRKQA